MIITVTPMPVKAMTAQPTNVDWSARNNVKYLVVMSDEIVADSTDAALAVFRERVANPESTMVVTPKES